MAVGNEKHGTRHVKILHIKRVITDIHTTNAKRGRGGTALPITDH
jgi:hypothetical protein